MGTVNSINLSQDIDKSSLKNTIHPEQRLTRYLPTDKNNLTTLYYRIVKGSDEHLYI